MYHGMYAVPRNWSGADGMKGGVSEQINYRIILILGPGAVQLKDTEYSCSNIIINPIKWMPGSGAPHCTGGLK